MHLLELSIIHNSLTLLQVSKKAANEADARKLLDDTYEIQDPFGFRVFYLSNDEFYGGQEKAVAKLSDIFRENAQETTGFQIDAAARFDNYILSHDYIVEKMQGSHKGAFLSEMGVELKTTDKTHTIFTRFIVALKEDATLRDFCGRYVKDDINTPMNAAQMRYFIAWHENAHLTGCVEPQADMLASVMTRQAFEDTTVLKVLADDRVIDSLSLGEKILTKYGWQTAEAIDFITNMDADAVDQLTEEDMWEMALMDFNNQKSHVENAVKTLLHVYRDEHPEEGEDIAISKLGPVTDRVIRAGFFKKDATEQKFLSRLGIALQRAANPALYADEGLNRKVCETFSTFPSDVPEFLPAPSDLSPEQ